MRSAAIALAVLAACSDPVAPPVEADASVDAATDAGPPGPLDGEWDLVWNCTENCQLPGPALALSNRLTVAGAALHWSSTTCVECVADHAGVVRDVCVDVAAAREPLDERDAYSLCGEDALTASAEVGVRRVGGTGATSRWRVTAARM